MKRFLVAVLFVAAVIAGVLWWRARPTATAPRTSHAFEGPATAGRPTATAEGAPSTPGQAGAPGAAIEADPPGLLRLEGQVIDSEDRPIAGALVGISSNPRRTVRTEADGSFAFTALVPRTYTVAAMKEEALGGPQTVRLTGHTEPVILRVATAGAVEVTVITAGERKPVAGATVTLRDALAPSGLTADDGKTTLHPVARGRHVLDASAPGFAPAVVLVAASGHGGDVQRVVVELQRGGGASGTVVDDSGAAVGNAEVRALSLGGARFGARGAQTARSDGDGRWSFAALPAGSYHFAATAEKHGPGSSDAVTLDGRTAKTGVVITLEAGAHIAGRVVKKDGTPVASATVRVMEGGRRGGPPGGPGPGGGPPGAGELRQTYTDANGHFDLDGLARRQMQLVALGETTSSAAITLDLAAQPEQLALSIVLDVDGTISGIVVDGKNQVVAGAQVTAMPAFGRRGAGAGAGAAGGPGAARLRGLSQDVSDSGGHFTLSGLPDGGYRLRATRDGATPFDDGFRGGGTTAAAGDTDVKLVLEDTGRVKGKVLFTDGTPPDSFTVSTGGLGLSFGGGGSFELDSPAGPVSVSVSGSQFLPNSMSGVQVNADATTDIGTISVQKGRSLSGTVIGTDGTPVAGATVVAGPSIFASGQNLATGGGFGGGAGTQTTTSGDDGGYLFTAAPAGGLLIAADHPTAGRSAIQRIPTGDGNVQLDLALLPLGALAGRVTSNGQPFGGAMVTATPQATGLGIFSTRADDTGAYRFDKLAPDTYTVTARSGGPGRGSAQSQTVQVAGGPDTRLDLDIPVGTVTVTANVAGPPGTRIAGAQVILLTGSLQASTAAQLADAVAARGDGSSHVGYVFGGLPAQITNVVPGAYSACAVPLPSTVQSPRDFAALRSKLDQLICICTAVTIPAAPESQSLSLSVPAPPPI